MAIRRVGMAIRRVGMKGRFVVFEGGEACGKSTQARVLADALGAVLTREPGGTPLGAELRRLLLDPASGELDIRAEALLMLADRAQHVASVVRPELLAGRHVVSDRFAGSTLAYQGYGRGLNVEELAHLSGWATGELWPDLTILLDVPLSVAAARVGEVPDRFEQAGEGFHTRVHEGFRFLAADDPDRWTVVDGTGTVDEVAERVRAVVRDQLGL